MELIDIFAIVATFGLPLLIVGGFVFYFARKRRAPDVGLPFARPEATRSFRLPPPPPIGKQVTISELERRITSAHSRVEEATRRLQEQIRDARSHPALSPFSSVRVEVLTETLRNHNLLADLAGRPAPMERESTSAKAKSASGAPEASSPKNKDAEVEVVTSPRKHRTMDPNDG